MSERYFPDAPVQVVSHGVVEDASGPTRGARPVLLLPDDDVPTVAVLGAIGPDKGARRLERLVELARGRNSKVRFVLIGYLDFQHGPYQSDDAIFSVHGHYATRDLPDLLAHYRVTLVLYPSAGPETFSFTLTEAWKEGRPALVPPIGALAERVEGTGAGWIMRETEWRDEARMLDRLEAILAAPDELARASAAGASDARACPVEAMAQRTLAHYEAASQAARRPTLRPLEKGRVLTRSAIGRGTRHRTVARSESGDSSRACAAPLIAPPGEACRPAVDAVRSRAHEGKGFSVTAAAFDDWLARGRVHRGEGRPADAIPCFRRAAREDPRSPLPHVPSWRGAVAARPRRRRGTAWQPQPTSTRRFHRRGSRLPKSR